MGNVIKLATENLREPDGGEFTRGHDVGALGALLYRALTGNELRGRGGLVEIAEPFAEMIRNTVKADPADRGKIAEILNACSRRPGCVRDAASGVQAVCRSPGGQRGAAASPAEPGPARRPAKASSLGLAGVAGRHRGMHCDGGTYACAEAAAECSSSCPRPPVCAARNGARPFRLASCSRGFRARWNPAAPH